jgi:hypothetical protein
MRDSSAILPPPTNHRRPVKSCSPSHRPKLPLPRLNAFLIEPFERPPRPSARTTPRLDTSLVKQPAPPSAAALRTPVHHDSRNPSSDPLGARPLRSSSTISGNEKGAGDAVSSDGDRRSRGWFLNKFVSLLPFSEFPRPSSGSARLRAATSHLCSIAASRGTTTRTTPSSTRCARARSAATRSARSPTLCILISLLAAGHSAKHVASLKADNSVYSLH